jgi:hypothetical protein
VWVVIAPSELKRRLGRGLVVGVGSLVVAAWVLVPLLTYRKYINQSVYYKGTFFSDSFGARKVLGWLFDGQLYDSGRFPIVSILVAIGLVVCIVRWRRDERGRALVGVWLFSLILFFGRPTLGPLLKLLPGSDDLQLHRFIMGVHLAGILLAGVGGAWFCRTLVELARKRLRRVPTFAPALAVVVVLVVILFPAWRERARYDASDRDFIRYQQLADATDGLNVIALIQEAERLGGGRIFAGLRATWGQDYKVGSVPVYHILEAEDADAIGLPYRTIGSLSSDVEALFDETNPADYDLYDVRYLLMPSDRDPAVPATIVDRKGSSVLWQVDTSGYLGVVDTAGQVIADRSTMAESMQSFIQSNAPATGPYPTVAFAGALAAPPSLPIGPAPEGAPGTFTQEFQAPADGIFGGEVKLSRPAAAILKSTFDPRWHVFVDGHELPPEMIAPSFVGRTIPAGMHQVVFLYSPYPYYGLLVSVGVLALLLLWFAPRKSFRLLPARQSRVDPAPQGMLGRLRGLLPRPPAMRTFVQRTRHEVLGRVRKRLPRRPPALGPSERDAAIELVPASLRAPQPDGSRSSRWERIAVASLLFIALAIHLSTLSQPITEPHSFRQSHNAYNTLLYHEQGISFLHPKIPIFGPPWEFPIEFPIYQALSSVPMSLGWSLEASLRTVCLLFFLLTGFLLWGLVRHVGGPIAAVASLAAFLFSPFDMLWSRTAMIEFVATAGAVGLAWAGILWREERRKRFAVLALVAGSLGMLVKVTTAIFWIAPAFAYDVKPSDRKARTRIRDRFDPVLVGVVAVSVLTFLIWDHWANSVRDTPATAWWGEPSFQITWYLGTIAQRLDPATWAPILQRINDYLAWPVVLLPLTIVVALLSRQRAFWLAIAATVVIPPFILTNQYWIHDYYLSALAPGIAALIGLSVAWLWSKLRTPQWRVVVCAGFVVWLGLALLLSRSYWGIAFNPDPPLPWAWAASEIDQFTTPADWVVVEGFGWNPIVLYEARRYGEMVWPPEVTTPEFMARLPGEGFHFLFTTGLYPPTAHMLRQLPWTGSLAPQLYVIGSNAGDLRGATLMSTDAPRQPGLEPLTTEPLILPCGGESVQIPRGTEATWLEIAPGAPETALVYLDGNLAGIPARHLVVAAPSVGGQGQPLEIACGGAASVTVKAVFSGPVPSGA